MNIQSVLFPIAVYTPRTAKNWLRTHHIKPIKRVHRTSHFLRYRIQEPDIFKGYITKKLNSGIDLVLGYN